MDITGKIPSFLVIMHDRDELIELVRSEFNDDVLRQKIKEKLEHANNRILSKFILSFGV